MYVNFFLLERGITDKYFILLIEFFINFYSFFVFFQKWKEIISAKCKKKKKSTKTWLDIYSGSFCCVSLKRVFCKKFSIILMRHVKQKEDQFLKKSRAWFLGVKIKNTILFYMIDSDTTLKLSSFNKQTDIRELCLFSNGIVNQIVNSKKCGF